MGHIGRKILAALGRGQDFFMLASDFPGKGFQFLIDRLPARLV